MAFIGESKRNPDFLGKQSTDPSHHTDATSNIQSESLKKLAPFNSSSKKNLVKISELDRPGPGHYNVD